MDSKICKRCKLSFENSLVYFRKDTKCNSGIGNVCRECENKRRRENHKLHPEKKRSYYWKNKERLLLSFKKNYLLHREERIRKSMEYASNNKDKKKLNVQRYCQKHHAERIERGRIYRENNREKLRLKGMEYYENNKPKCKIASRKWNDNNRDVCNITTQRYRNIKAKLESTLTLEQWTEIKQYFNNECAYCGKASKLTQDHFVPLTKGGGYTKDNIIPVCGSCNPSKSNKLFSEWYPKYKHYSAEREQKVIQYILLNERRKII